MPFCPNCGSYVSPAANVCSCGTTFGLRPKDQSVYETGEIQTINKVDEWCRQGSKLMNCGEYLNAIEYFDKALEVFPEYHRPLFAKAQSYYYAGMYGQALMLLDKSKFSHFDIGNYLVFEWI